MNRSHTTKATSLRHVPSGPPAQTAKSLESGGSVQANAREQVQRRHYSVMDQLVGAGQVPASVQYTSKPARALASAKCFQVGSYNCCCSCALFGAQAFATVCDSVGVRCVGDSPSRLPSLPPCILIVPLCRRRCRSGSKRGSPCQMTRRLAA